MNAAGNNVANLVAMLAPSYGFDKVDPGLIVAQSKLETGSWTSPIFREQHNPFGMKQAKVRPTTAIGTARGHAMYPSVEAGVKDYFLRQQNFRMPNTPDVAKYIAATVGSGYAEDPNYVRKWLENYKGLGPVTTAQAAGIGGIGALLLGLVVLYLRSRHART